MYVAIEAIKTIWKRLRFYYIDIGEKRVENAYTHLLLPNISNTILCRYLKILAVFAVTLY